MTRVVAGMISRKNDHGEDEYLLVSSRRDFGEFTGYYYPPAGHIEEGEDEETALIREVKEELGLDIEPVTRIVETPGDVDGQITYWWRCKVVSGDIKVQKEELADAGYFSKAQIESMNIWPATRKVFEQYLFI